MCSKCETNVGNKKTETEVNFKSQSPDLFVLQLVDQFLEGAHEPAARVDHLQS